MDYPDYSNTTTMRWLPEPRVAPLAPAIQERVQTFSALIRPANFGEFLDPLMQRLLIDCFRDAKANEGVVWLLDAEKQFLSCGWQIGAYSRNLINFRQPVDATISGMVLTMQQPFCENSIPAHPGASSKLDEKLGVIVCSRILVPFSFAGKIRGVVACYQTKPSADAPEPRGFDAEAVEEMTLLTRLLGRLLDYRMLCAATGVDED